MISLTNEFVVLRDRKMHHTNGVSFC